MSDSLTCPRCSAEMERGFIMDASEAGPKQSVWVEDVPETATFLGMQVAKGVVKVRGKRRLIVDTYRCTKCGLLESHAQSSAP